MYAILAAGAVEVVLKLDRRFFTREKEKEKLLPSLFYFRDLLLHTTFPSHHLPSSFHISNVRQLNSFQYKEKLPINFEIDSFCGGGERRLWIPIKKSLACISSSDWTLMERFSTPFLRKTTGDRKVPLGETWCFLNHQVSDWLPFELLKKNWQVLSWEKETSYKRKIL